MRIWRDNSGTAYAVEAPATVVAHSRLSKSQTCRWLAWKRAGNDGFELCSNPHGQGMLVPYECRFCQPPMYESTLAARTRERNGE